MQSLAADVTKWSSSFMGIYADLLSEALFQSSESALRHDVLMASFVGKFIAGNDNSCGDLKKTLSSLVLFITRLRRHYKALDLDEMANTTLEQKQVRKEQSKENVFKSSLRQALFHIPSALLVMNRKKIINQRSNVIKFDTHFRNFHINTTLDIIQTMYPLSLGTYSVDVISYDQSDF